LKEEDHWGDIGVHGRLELIKMAPKRSCELDPCGTG